MKKVVVVKLELHDDQAKQKAMKAASKLPGIDSMAIDMKEQKMTVIGAIDPVEVVSRLRKLWNAQIFSVEPVKEPEPKKEEAKKEEPKKEEPKKEEPKKEEPKKEEPKKEEAEKKEEPKPSTEQNNIAELVKAYQSYNPHMTTHYYVQSAEENPNSCVIC